LRKYFPRDGGKVASILYASLEGRIPTLHVKICWRGDGIMAIYTVWLAVISQAGRTCETDDKEEGGLTVSPLPKGTR
jgi:hypothetical protein